MPDTNDVNLFHLPSAGTPPLPSLAFGSWDKTSQAIRLPLTTTPTDTPSVERSMLSSPLASERHLCIQFQMRGLAAQTFGGTLKGQIRGLHNHTLFQGTVAIAARIVSEDGLTIRGHLIGPTPVAPTATTNPPQFITSKQNRKFRDNDGNSDIAVAAITCLNNDVLVIEVGTRDNDTDTSQSGFLRFQDLIAGGDLPEDESSTAALNPWVRFSQPVSFRIPAQLEASVGIRLTSAVDLTAVGQATTNYSRFYLPATGTAPLTSQAYGSGWNKNSQAARLPLKTAPSNTADAQYSMLSSPTTPEFHLSRQFQITNLAAQTISGTLKGQIRAEVNNAGFVGTVAIAARIVSVDGATVRGELIGTTPAASVSVATPPELSTTITNRRFRDSTDATDIPLSTVVVQRGDVLIVEIGARDVDNGTSRSAFLNFQDLIAGGDLPENETTTTALNPWIEFSSPVKFITGPPTAALAASLGIRLTTSATLSGAPRLTANAGIRFTASADLLAATSQPISATFALGLSSAVQLSSAVDEVIITGGSGVIARVGGLSRNMLYGWTVTMTINGRSTFRGQFESNDGSYRPGLDEQVFITRNGVTLFGGFVTNPYEAGVLGEGGQPIVTTANADDMNTLASRRYIFETVPAGTMKAALQRIVTWLEGVTLDPAQVDGPLIPQLVYVDVLAIDCLNDVALLANGYLWSISGTKVLKMYEPGTIAAPFNITESTFDKAIGDVTVEPKRDRYANNVIVKNATTRVVANSAADQAQRGIWSAVYVAPDTTPLAGMQAMADMILARSLPILKVVVYHTMEHGLMPGQSQTITLPRRNLNNIFLITDVIMTGYETGIMYDVTAIEGLVYQPGWRETYRQWSAGGMSISGAAYSVSAGLTRFAYFLGGNGIDAVQSPVPTWVPASGGGVIGQGAVQVQINTVPRGTTAGTIVARLRALDPGVSVRARLYDVTDSVACPGTSVLVTSTTWVTVTFGVTLTPGSHLYELQLLPGTANADVMATAYLE